MVDTPAGRIGIGVCYDLWFPEHARGLALAGAEILVFPSNLSHSPAQDGLPHLDVVTALATAHVNRVHLVVADRCGTERGHRWLGAALVVDADGTLLARRCPTTTGRPTALATLDLAAARDKRWGAWNDVLADRRPGLYGSAVVVAAGACRIGNRRCRTASSLARRRGVREASCALSRSRRRVVEVPNSVANAATVQRRG